MWWLNLWALEITFRQALLTGVFPSEWKKVTLFLSTKKSDKQNIKDYRPVSLLPICGKIFEKLIFNEVFKLFACNNLISPNQLWFKPGDSCINQLLLITHKIYKSFDDELEVTGVFLDISNKAFDKAWYEGLIFKLKQNGISADLLQILSDFLSNRKQRVVNGQNSSWTNVHAGVPQGSILRPLLFLIYINELADDLSSNVTFFADDALFSVVHNVNASARELNDDLKKINKWAF